MPNQAGKLMNSRKQYSQAVGPVGGGAGPEVASSKDSELLNNFHDRAYNPADSAEKCKIGEKLNGDAGRYKKGPGPF